MYIIWLSCLSLWLFDKGLTFYCCVYIFMVLLKLMSSACVFGTLCSFFPLKSIAFIYSLSDKITYFEIYSCFSIRKIRPEFVFSYIFLSIRHTAFLSVDLTVFMWLFFNSDECNKSLELSFPTQQFHHDPLFQIKIYILIFKDSLCKRKHSRSKIVT